MRARALGLLATGLYVVGCGGQASTDQAGTDPLWGCLDQPAADDLTQVLYPAGGSANGHGGFNNLPAGTATLSAEILATGRIIGTTVVHVRPDAITHAVLAPAGK
jgi:hypothetical protein